MSFYSKFQKYKIPVLENGVKLPPFTIEKRHTERLALPHDCSDYEFLEALCEEGLSKRKIEGDLLEYRKRMASELSVLNELGFCSYLLITWDIINYCRENDIPTGYGRGSAGNSLVLYLIGVTEIDSLKQNLYFERFLNKTRAKFSEIDGVKYYQGDLLMDVDLDISFSHRGKLIEWLNIKYKGFIAKLPTSTTLTTKILFKEISKCYLGYAEFDAMALSGTIPVEFGKPYNIDKCIKESPEFKQFADENPEVISFARKLYLLNRNVGTHASAWIITADPIGETFPLQLTKDDELCSVYTMEDSLNLAIKVDVLGLRCASLIDRVCGLVKINPYTINTRDEDVFRFLQNITCPKGLFQVEADCNYRVLKQVKPKTLDHLAAIVALARPGVLQFASVYAKYVDTGEFQSVHPFFDDILRDTAGIPLYQESLLRMANKVGFTLSESETLRRIVGKKKTSEMAEWQNKVKEKVAQNNLPPEVGDILWKIMDDSKNYSFNAGHANAYGLMAYVTAYLKYHHPMEFFLALLELSAFEQNTIEEIQIIQSELRNFDIKLIGPDLVTSELGFSIEGKNIRFGLGFIKGIAEKSFQKLRDFKHEFSDKFQIFSGASESGLNVGIVASLIQAGCLDRFLYNNTRSKMVWEYQVYNKLSDREKLRVIELGKDFNYDLFAIFKHLKTELLPNGKTFFTPKKYAALQVEAAKYSEIYNQNSGNEKLASYFYEKRLIGYGYSNKLSDIIRDKYPEVVDISEVSGLFKDDAATIIGEILEVKYFVSKKNMPMCKIRLSDSTGSVSLLLSNNKKRQTIEACELENGGKFEEGQIVIAKCKKGKEDELWGDTVKNQNLNIYIKLSDVKSAKKKQKEVDKAEVKE